MSDGTRYLPDFYLPDVGCFFEVKGNMKERDTHKILRLMEDTGVPVIVGHDNLEFTACDHWDKDDGLTPWEVYKTHWFGRFELGETPEHEWTMADGPGSSYLVKCDQCGKLYFVGIDGDYNCPHCGQYHGGRLDFNYNIMLNGELGYRKRPFDEKRYEAAFKRFDGR